MLYIQGKYLKATELAARGDFPPSYLVTVFDDDAAEALNLICDRKTYGELAGLDQLSPVTLRLRWRRVDLAQLGGSGRGKAYRLQITGTVAS